MAYEQNYNTFVALYLEKIQLNNSNNDLNIDYCIRKFDILNSI